MKLLFLFAVILASVYSEKVKYNGYTVLRMQINSTNFLDIQNIADMYNLDIWAQNSIEKWMDIMIPPNQDIIKVIKQHDHIVSIPDVEEHIQSMEINQTSSSRKRQAFFDYFPNYEEVSQWLDTQLALYPSNSRSFEVGQTFQGNAIRGIRIFKGTSAKPAVFLQGGIHAREWITVTTALYIIQELLALPPILDFYDFYIVPVFNIDGYNFAHASNRLWRKNRQSVSGSSCLGTDLNRNYQWEWGRGGSSTDPCSDTFMGRTPGSTPEVSGITNFLTNQVPNVIFFLDIHSYGSMFMSPWGYSYNYPPTQDYTVMDTVMQVARSSIRAVNQRTYAIGTSANVIYIASGGSDDWSYGQLGVVPSFTVEIAGSSFIAPTSQILPLAQEILAGVLGVTDYLSKQ
jgi:murein tripeptide amidase MpaA